MKPAAPKIIIKKKRVGHGGAAHGGSWKVAYADFVTAMMAFFLMLWLITMVSPEKRARVATYFNTFGIFDQSGHSLMNDGAGVLQDGNRQAPRDTVSAEPLDGITIVSETTEDFREKLQRKIDTELSEYKGQVAVYADSTGVRIEIMDNEGAPIFPLASSEMNANGKGILAVICETILSINNQIVIEGHTDALTYSSNRYTNWELSTERASAARRQLENHGLDPNRLAMVAGYAATRPLVDSNPHDPRNRRISIQVLYGTDYRDRF